MAKGAAWMLSFKLAHKSLGLVSTIILARLLVPADFGLVAMATAFIGALELLSAFSFDVALIQHPEPRRSHYDTVWTIQIVFAAAIGLVLVLFSVPISSFYDEPRLTMIVLALAAGTFITGFDNTGIIKFRKELQFDKDFMYRMTGKVVGFCVTVPAAFYFRSYWALVIGMLAAKVARLVTSYYLSPFRPKLSLSEFRDLFNFSKWLFINNLLFFLRHRASNFVIGKISGPVALGTFSVAYEISGIPTNEVVAPINRAIFPGYVKMASSIDTLRKGYLDVIGMIAVFAIPAAIGILVTAELLVAVLLGPKWAAAAPLIKIMGVAGAITAMETNVGTVYLALGRPRILTLLAGAHVAILLPLLILLTYKFGITGAAWALLLAAAITMPLQYGAMLLTLKLRIADYLAVTWRPVVGSAVMYVAVRGYLGDTSANVSTMEALPDFTAAAAIGVGSYCAALLILWVISARPQGAEAAILHEAIYRIRKFA
jgi:O-antigen/teichoic acid export membrane protein